jgi:hypothetical protein
LDAGAGNFQADRTQRYGSRITTAFKVENWDLAKEWVQKDIPLDSVDSDSGWSMLHYAAYCGRGDLVKNAAGQRDRFEYPG